MGGSGHPNYFRFLYASALEDLREGRAARALESMLKVLAMQRQELEDERDPALAATYADLSLAYEATGDLDAALECEARALEIESGQPRTDLSTYSIPDLPPGGP